MPLFHVLVLAVVQGITEFLPVSSSGHLVVAWDTFDLAGWPVPEQTPADRLTLDIAVHVGTLAAVCLYFWRDLWQMTLGLLKLAVGQMTPGARLALYVIAASLPLIAVGYLFKEAVTNELHNVTVVAWATIAFGVVLLVADRMGLTIRRVEHMTLGGALFVGLAQVLALIPGVSRSGITMTAARFLGYERPEAARFSLLLSIPAILGAGTAAGQDLFLADNPQLSADAAIATGMSFVVALIAIALMIRWLRHAGFMPFVVYRLFFGAALLIWID